MKPEWIIHWSESAQALKGIPQGKAIVTKAHKLVKLGLVKETENEYLVYPIKGYNKTIYHVTPNTCTCQFYNTVSKYWDTPTCSHIQAVKMYREIGEWNKGGYNEQ